jgi:hypothetical protein
MGIGEFMKNLLKNHTSTALDSLEFDNSVTYRTTHSRAAKRPKLSTLFIRSVRSNWQNMERLAMVATVVGSFALGFPVSTVHAQDRPETLAMVSPQIGIEIGAPLVEPVCSYGYYDYAPYACAPYGFWGHEYFFEGHFRGAGPWNGRGHGYNRGSGEKNFHQANHAAGRSKEMGSRGGGEHAGSNGGSHER